MELYHKRYNPKGLDTGRPNPQAEPTHSKRGNGQAAVNMGTGNIFVDLDKMEEGGKIDDRDVAVVLSKIMAPLAKFIDKVGRSGGFPPNFQQQIRQNTLWPERTLQNERYIVVVRWLIQLRRDIKRLVNRFMNQSNQMRTANSFVDIRYGIDKFVTRPLPSDCQDIASYMRQAKVWIERLAGLVGHSDCKATIVLTNYRHVMKRYKNFKGITQRYSDQDWRSRSNFGHDDIPEE